jgi:hypothetical protein
MAKRTVASKKPEMDVPVVADKPAEFTAFDQFVEHQKKALSELAKALEALLPEGLREHGEAAVRESVEGYRRLFNDTLDSTITRLEKVKFETKPMGEYVEDIEETFKDVEKRVGDGVEDMKKRVRELVK